MGLFYTAPEPTRGVSPEEEKEGDVRVRLKVGRSNGSQQLFRQFNDFLLATCTARKPPPRNSNIY